MAAPSLTAMASQRNRDGDLSGARKARLGIVSRNATAMTDIFYRKDRLEFPNIKSNVQHASFLLPLLKLGGTEKQSAPLTATVQNF
jgi:hypothetical protein